MSEYKYTNCCDAFGFKCVPFVLYTNGRLHKAAMDFLEALAKQASDRRKIPVSTIKNYYLKLISVCLVQRIGYIISTKSNGWQINNIDLVDAYRHENEKTYDIGGDGLD